MLATTRTLARLFAVAVLTVGLVGCAEKTAQNTTTAATDPKPAPAPAPAPAGEPDEVQAERAKLSPEDRALVDAQEWCVISNDERLGSMGPPVKLTLNGQTVFVCCKGCLKRAHADPDKTLATAAELKAKAKAERVKNPH